MNVIRLFPVYFTLLMAAMLGAGQLRAQTITVTTTNTATVCFNDGTLTINATGGTGPYTDSILSGPTGPNLSYPIALPTGVNVFPNLTHGSYTVVVHDAAGHSATITASVGGTYQFPTLNIHQYGLTAPTSGLVALVFGGRAPYQYALSATNSSSGFGPYQSSDTFRGMCPGTYWLRVWDSCGNIFTSPQYYGYNLSLYTNCASYSRGTLSVTASGAHPPYTYVYRNTYPAFSDTNRTGFFSGLPSNFSGFINVTDSCGVTGGYRVGPSQGNLYTKCPFDSNLYYQYNTGFGDTFTFICTSCNPRQTTVVTSQQNAQLPYPVFSHLSSPSVSFITLKNQNSQCGADTLRSTIFIGPSPYHFVQQYISCRSFGYKVKDSAGNVIPVDSFVLTRSNSGIRKVDTSGLYFDLVDGSYNLVAYIRGGVGCTATLTNSFQVPQMPQVCYYLMEDSSCQASYFGRIQTVSSPEKFSFLIPYSGMGIDTVPLLPYGSYDIGYGLPPARGLSFISDSGCVGGLSTPLIDVPIVSAVTPCVGPPSIQWQNLYRNWCGAPFPDTVLVKFYHLDSLCYSYVANYSNFSNGFIPSDTGWYHYEYYQTIQSSDGDPAHLRYDTICPLDSGSVYVTNSHIPYPSPTTVYTACDTVAAAGVIFTLTGGTAPYTVQIPGQDTITLSGQTGLFPTRHIGTYTMIVYDYCGISRSYTFSILDTCTVHICPGVLAGPDLSVCAGVADTLRAQPAVYVPGAHYLWQPGGDTSATLIVTPAATGTTTIATYTVTMTVSGCTPVSDTVVMIVRAAPSVAISQDTAICIGSSALLTATPSQTGGQYLWTPGNLATQSITATPAVTTTYHLRYTLGQCSNSSDSVVVTVSNPALSLSVHDTSLCAGSSLLVGSSVSQAGGSYLWTPDGVTSSSLLLSPATAGTHTLSYTLQGCSAADSVHVHLVPAPALSGSNASVCQSAAMLTATPSVPGGHYLWSTGDTTAGITVSPAVQTVYTLTYTTGCGSATVADTVFAGQPPAISSVNAAICSGTGATLTAFVTVQGGHYLWTPGRDTTASISVSPDSTSIYTVVYTTTCGTVQVSDTVFVSPAPAVSLADTAVCAGQTATLTAIVSAPGGQYLWSTGESTPTISITPVSTGYITVSYTVAGCAAVSATDTVTVYPLPLLTLTPAGVSCYGVNDGSVTANVSPAGSYTYHWADGSSSAADTGLASGTYALTVSDAHHCSVSGSAAVAGAGAASLIGLPADTTVHVGQPVQLSTIFGGYPVSSITAYQWIPAWGLNCDNCPAPVASLPDGDTIAVYTVTVTYSNGCKVAASDTIHVNTSEGMTTPDAFSPNGDGVNDTYIIRAYGVAAFHMNIYNRWGELVFSTDDIRNGWDGTYRGKPQPSEIYEVFISIAYLDGRSGNAERNITLLR